MEKRVIRRFSLLFSILLVMGFVFLQTFPSIRLGIIELPSIGMAWAQTTEGESQDSHYIQLMRQLRAKLDGWLKDLNQRIESEDVTRFEVRFLEMLRSFLEWVREKIDAQIETGQKVPKKRTRGEDL